MFDSTTRAQYRALKDDVGQFPIGGSLVRLTGEDRFQFLHNFCTNEIKALPQHAICEALILDGKGKILFHVHVLNGSDCLWLYSVADDADSMIEHLDKYLLRDDVQMSKVVDRHITFMVGPNAASAASAASASLPSLPKSRLVELPEGTVVGHLELAGWGFLCLSPHTQFVPKSIETVGDEAFHAIRIEQQTPWMGIEIDHSNLPQELLRDEKCISFTKGCYLGQETVARIDAIGRVNRVLVFTSFKQPLPTGALLMVADKKVGEILASAWSPDHQCFIGAAIVRRPHEKPGTELIAATVKVTVN